MKTVIQIFVGLTLLMVSCKGETSEQPQGSWINGTPAEQLDLIEGQFRGFDMAMVETGYRYQELYWAGVDEHWAYAAYQVEKIKKAIENGLVRRPKRKQSASYFLTDVLPKMVTAIEAKDSVVFHANFQNLTRNCNACHAMENVSFFTVKPPLNRQSPIRK